MNITQLLSKMSDALKGKASSINSGPKGGSSAPIQDIPALSEDAFLLLSAMSNGNCLLLQDNSDWSGNVPWGGSRVNSFLSVGNWEYAPAGNRDAFSVSWVYEKDLGEELESSGLIAAMPEISKHDQEIPPSWKALLGSSGVLDSKKDPEDVIREIVYQQNKRDGIFFAITGAGTQFLELHAKKSDVLPENFLEKCPRQISPFVPQMPLRAPDYYRPRLPLFKAPEEKREVKRSF